MFYVPSISSIKKSAWNIHMMLTRQPMWDSCYLVLYCFSFFRLFLYILWWNYLHCLYGGRPRSYLQTWVNYTYYKCSNTYVGYTEQELIKMFKHKVYAFYIHLQVISPCPSHFIIQFISVGPRNKRTKLLVLFSGFCYSKITFSIVTNLLLRYGVISIETMSLEYLVGSQFPLWIGIPFWVPQWRP